MKQVMPESEAPAPAIAGFSGWWMMALAFLLYGFGMAPAYYGWGFLAPEIMAEIDLSREQVGNTFGLFTLTFALTSPLAAAAILRVGLRPVIAIGAVIASIGFEWTARASTVGELLFAYAVLGGIGIGLTTLLPAQLLPVNWFRQYRARATAVILSGAAVVGAGVPTIANWLVDAYDWRMVWHVIAAVMLLVGTTAAVFLRTHPRDLGQFRDGILPYSESCTDEAGDDDDRDAESRGFEDEGPSIRKILLDPRFLFVTLACLSNAVPWRVVTAHGRLHLEDLGFGAALAAGILGVRVGVSGAGRLVGGVGDFLDPRGVLGLSLIANALGLMGLAFATTSTAGYFAIALLGAGYGVAFTNEPVVVAHVFGARAFVSLNGIRLALTGVFGWLGPRWTGAVADATGSYSTSFIALSGLCLVGAISLVFCRPMVESK